MGRLSKAEIKAHGLACDLLAKERLAPDEREFVLANWQASAHHINSAAGAFFTPAGLAQCVALHVSDAETVVDLCAGIGALAYQVASRWPEPPRRLVCVEINPDYAAVGRKVVPEAEWVVADVLALHDLGQFDCAISNPPFGKTPKGADRVRLPMDLAVVEVASHLADFGVFILPQMSCPFAFSGRRQYERRATGASDRFIGETGLHLECGSIDTSVYADDWQGISAPAVEVVTCDFLDREVGAGLFAEAA